MTSDNPAADQAFMVLGYIFYAVMLLICIGAVVLISKWLRKGPTRTFGMSGFGMLALSTLTYVVRNIMLDMARADQTLNSINGSMINMIDFLTALIRLVGIGTLAVAILSVGRDVGAMMRGGRSGGANRPQGTVYEGTQYQTQATNYQTQSTNYIPQSQPSAPGQGMPPQGMPPQQQPPSGWRPQG